MFFCQFCCYFFIYLFELFMEDLRPWPRSDFYSILVSNFITNQILLKVCPLIPTPRQKKKKCKWRVCIKWLEWIKYTNPTCKWAGLCEPCASAPMWQQISNSKEGVCFQWLEASLSERLARPSVENLQDFSNLARSRLAWDWLSSKQSKASGLLFKIEQTSTSKQVIANSVFFSDFESLQCSRSCLVHVWLHQLKHICLVCSSLVITKLENYKNTVLIGSRCLYHSFCLQCCNFFFFYYAVGSFGG